MASRLLATRRLYWLHDKRTGDAEMSDRRFRKQMWHPAQDELAIAQVLTILLACVWGLVAVYMLVQVYS